MGDGLPLVLTIITAIGSGIVGGVFFAFSTFVMRGLARLPAPSGIAAMQAINVAAPTPPFMMVLFGSALTGIATGILAIVEWGDAATSWALIGAIASVVPAALTIAFHVPRNEALARVDRDGVEYWTRYVREWTAGNHLRTIGGIAAALALTVSIVS